MQLQWPGGYLDGVSANRRPVTIILEATHLRILLEDGTTQVWPYGEIRQTQGSYGGEQVRLEHGGELGAALLIDDDAFLTAFHQLLPGRARGFHDPSRRRQRAQLTILAGIAALVIIVAGYLWGIPALAKAATPWVPVSWEEQLGQSVVAHFAPDEERCHDPVRLARIQQIVDRLLASQPAHPYRFKIHVANQPIFNALAAPGGQIVIFRGLLERTENAEELAGVLAHELQHVLKRHVTQSLVQHASTSFLIAAVLGDVTGMLSFGVEAAQLMAQMRFSRQHESEADVEGFKMLLAAHIDPAGMIRFFEAVRKEEVGSSVMPGFLASHPQTVERIDKLRALAADSATQTPKLLADYRWDDIKKICRTADKPAKS